MRRLRRVPGRLDPVVLAALRDLVAPPAESEAEAERSVAAIMGYVLAASATAPATAPAGA